jgi:hypothetical protein
MMTAIAALAAALLASTPSIPLDAPVTIATFPVNLLIAIFLNA